MNINFDFRIGIPLTLSLTDSIKRDVQIIAHNFRDLKSTFLLPVYAVLNENSIFNSVLQLLRNYIFHNYIYFALSANVNVTEGESAIRSTRH